MLSGPLAQTEHRPPSVPSRSSKHPQLLKYGWRPPQDKVMDVDLAGGFRRSRTYPPHRVGTVRQHGCRAKSRTGKLRCQPKPPRARMAVAARFSLQRRAMLIVPQALCAAPRSTSEMRMIAPLLQSGDRPAKCEEFVQRVPRKSTICASSRVCPMLATSLGSLQKNGVDLR